MSTSGKHYDLAVIGGGSGGMAAAKEAAALGASVVLFDYVKPSTQGTTWGLGGTCVNVGCVPKKLMHYAATIGHSLHHDAEKFGFNFNDQPPSFRWSALVGSVQNHVKKLNFGYRNGLRSAKVEYINALATFKDANTITYEMKGDGNAVTAKNILLATGGRPTVPADVPGALEYAITSDDLFSMRKTPGKTLVVGASYIALECAGLLNGIGFETTVAVRSQLLRGFDRQCAEKIGEMMRVYGTRFVQKLPAKIEKDAATNRLNVTFNDDSKDTFDTVLYAVGRYADTQKLNLEAAGVKALSNGKFDVNELEQTNVKHIYAIGDILNGKPELTPVAIKTGELLARRLFGGSQVKMDWNLVPTTVFTPAEYGTVGLSEEAAQAQYGPDVETYLWEWTTLEHAAAHREKVEWERENEYDVDFPTSCLAKLVVLKSQKERVIGFHYVGPNAGEVTQGFAVAMRAGATKADFDNTVGIHPTDAEALVTMAVTRSSGENFIAAGGCGGGKCG